MSSAPIDVLVVGAGSAGLFCALGLVERGATVTIIEAGDDPGTPPPDWLLHDYSFPPSLDWGYRETDTGAELLRGKVTGGSSSVNSSAAVRGQPWCFDAWGSEQWDWRACLEGFTAIEHDEQFGGADYHGDTGPIPITRLEPGPVDLAVIDICKRLGHPELDDHNRPGAFGIGVWPTNRVGGGRWGTHAGVLPLLRGRVTLRTGTSVQRVIFEGTRCIGAELAGPHGLETLSAQLVVLSAGSFGSPEILVRSGIGPEATLSELGISPVSVLEGVGQNLHDHPWCLLDVQTVDPDAPLARPVSGSLLRYELSGGEHIEAQIFPWQTQPYVADVPRSQLSFSAALMAPTSRGSLQVTPRGTRIRLRHLDSEADARRMADIVALTAELLRQLAHAGVIAAPDTPWWHDDDVVAASRRRVGTYNHPVGTCAMGRSDDPTAVVDEHLALIGTTGLFVADASIMPVIPRAGTNLTAMMIGQRAGTMVGRERSGRDRDAG
jgi:choline dehydrogenase